MSEPLTLPLHPDDHDLARLYRLQVRELEDFALFVAAPDGRLLTWNQGVQKVFGYTEQEWLGKHFRILFTEEDQAAGVVENEMRSAAEHGRCVDIRWHQRQDGSRVYMNGVLKSLHDDEGTLIGYSKVFLDDTARKLLEDALTQSNFDLQQFAFIASHDLQEPLRTLSSFADLLLRRGAGQLTAEFQEILGFMHQATKRLDTLIRDLLAYSQLHHEKGPAISVHLDEDLETAVSLLQAQVQQTGGRITHDSLPNVEIDRSQLVRIFQNLLGNALKFCRPDQPPVIHVSAESQEKEWLIRVTDNGIGFPPEEAEAIFAPFKRLHSADEYPGSGIGLAACKRMVESYGGRIGAQSVPGEGSTFWFTIPVSAGEQEDRPSAFPGSARQAATGHRST